MRRVFVAGSQPKEQLKSRTTGNMVVDLLKNMVIVGLGSFLGGLGIATNNRFDRYTRYSNTQYRRYEGLGAGRF